LHYTFDCIYHRSPMWIACYQALDEHVQKSVPISKTVKRFFFFKFLFQGNKMRLFLALKLNEKSREKRAEKRRWLTHV
jgi:hypothetical protein